MSRAALVDKLWSDRDERLGSDSLRQAVKAVRDAAGDKLFVSGNGWIGLNPDTVEVDLSRRLGALNAAFASDLDPIKDPEFESWLRDARTQFEAGGPGTAVPPKASVESAVPGLAAIVIDGAEAIDPSLRMKGEMLLNEAAARAAQLCNADHLPPDAAQARPTVLRMSVMLDTDPGRILLQPVLHRTGTDPQSWTQRFSAPPEALADMMTEAAAAMTVAVVSMASAGPFDAAEAADPRLPFADIFSFDPIRLHRADAALAGQFEQTRRPQLLAMRAFIRHTLIMERLDPDPERLRAEAWEFVRHAQEAAPHSAFILGAGSLIAGVCGKDPLSLELAREACRADPDHAFARHCLSVALSFNGQPEAAHREALVAHQSRMSALTPPIFHLRNAFTAIGVGDVTNALNWAELAVTRAPDFRAAQRVVAALRYVAGDEGAARDALLQLKALEPDFSLGILESDAYPVDTLRSAGLLQIARSGLI